MPPKSQVEKIIADLQALAEGLGDVSDLEEHSSRARADYDSQKQALAQIRAELQDSRAQLLQSQRLAQQKFEQDMFNKQGELRNLTERVKILEARAKELDGEVGTKEGQLRAASLAMEDMKRKLAS
jgi:chromosome segregation ATPase